MENISNVIIRSVVVLNNFLFPQGCKGHDKKDKAEKSKKNCNYYQRIRQHNVLPFSIESADLVIDQKPFLLNKTIANKPTCCKKYFFGEKRPVFE